MTDQTAELWSGVGLVSSLLCSDEKPSNNCAELEGGCMPMRRQMCNNESKTVSKESCSLSNS